MYKFYYWSRVLLLESCLRKLWDVKTCTHKGLDRSLLAYKGKFSVKYIQYIVFVGQQSIQVARYK